MEAAVLTFLSEHPTYGWGLLALVVVTVCASIISRGVLAVVHSVLQLKQLVILDSKNYKHLIKNEADVTNVLKTVREGFGADRVVVLQYHNGVRSVAHNHLLKVSATHEVLAPNVKGLLNSIQQWPANFISDWNDTVFDNRYLVVEEHELDGKCRNLNGVFDFLYSYGAKHAVVFPMTDSYGDVFGLGMVLSSSRFNHPSETQLQWGHQRFQAIGALLAGVPKV